MTHYEELDDVTKKLSPHISLSATTGVQLSFIYQGYMFAVKDLESVIKEKDQKIQELELKIKSIKTLK